MDKYTVKLIQRAYSGMDDIYNHIAEKSHVENEMSKMNLPETVPAVV